MNNNSSGSNAGSKLCSRTQIKRRARYRKVVIEGVTSSSTDSSSKQDAPSSKMQRLEHNSLNLGSIFHLVEY